MKLDTTLALNQLNQEFYETTARSFNRSRQYFWQGWQQLEPLLKQLQDQQDRLNVFDAGCGNGRFAQFLADLKIEFEYTGLESNSDLLRYAQQTINKLKINHKLIEFDLIEGLINDNLTEKFDQKFNLIAVFGLIHHIPGFKLRKKLLEQLAELLSADGYLVITAWQFAADDRFLKREVDPALVNIKAQDLEKNDFILDWRKGERAFRYCHFVDEEEVERLSRQIEELSLENTFLADSKSGELNRYLLFKKNHQDRGF